MMRSSVLEGVLSKAFWKARNLRIGDLKTFWAAQVTVAAVNAQASAQSYRNFQLTQNGSHVTSDHSIGK